MIQFDETLTCDTPPISMGMTEFHILLLFHDRLVVRNRMSKEIIWSHVFERGVSGQLRGLVHDCSVNSLWLFSANRVYRVTLCSYL